MCFNLYVGDTTDIVSISAKQNSIDAQLVDFSNYKSILNNNHIVGKTFYTSLGDLPDQYTLWKLLNKASSIYYCPSSNWSDGVNYDYSNVNDDSHQLYSLQVTTEFLLLAIQKEKEVPIHNFNTKKFKPYYSLYLDLVDTRKTEHSQLWVSGCSITAGEGVNDTDRYGYLLSKKLNIPVSFLAANGSSIEWAADQIIRSNIKKNDIVVWGLTAVERFPFWATDVNALEHVSTGKIRNNLVNETEKYYSKKQINLMTLDPTRLYKMQTCVRQVIKFCNLVGAKLLIVGLISPYKANYYFAECVEFIQYTQDDNAFPTSFTDLGTDKMHPGPKQHKQYANFCYNQLKRLNYIS